MIEEIIDKVMKEIVGDRIDKMPDITYKSVSPSDFVPVEYDITTLEGALLNQAETFHKSLASVAEEHDVNLTQIGSSNDEDNIKNTPAENYKTFNIDAFSQHLMVTIICAHSSIESMKKLENSKLPISVAEMKLSEKRINRYGLKLDKYDTIESFLSKPRNIHAKDKLQHDEIEGLVNTIAVYFEAKEIKDKFDMSYKTLKQALNVLYELDKNVHFIQDVKKWDNITVSDDVVNDYLIRLVNGSISISGVKKRITQNITQKPATELAFQNVTEEKKDKAVVEYLEKFTNPQERKYLAQRGLKPQLIKDILSENHYDSVIGFITSLEDTFTNYGLEKKDAYKIFESNPGIFKMNDNEKMLYIDAIEGLFDFIDPKKVSGILPRHMPQIYSSRDSMKKFIEEKNRQTSNVHIESLDKITNAKDRECFEAKAIENPFFGNTMDKWVSRGFGKYKTAMYDAYSKEFGEGLFKKVRFGERRAVYKLSNNGSGNYVVDVCMYFENHSKYDAKYTK